MPTPTNPTDRDRFRAAMDVIKATIEAEHPHPPVAELVRQNVALKAEASNLAALLDGVLADDPQAIRDAAQWLTVNRPAVPGGVTVGVRWLDGEGER